jgi:imidazolonepropionase
MAERPARAPTGAACDFVLRGAGELVTMRGPDLGVIERGALAAREGRIVWTGEESELERVVAVRDDALVVDAEGAAVLPGFVDAHTHAVFAGERAGEYGERLAGVSYQEILARGGGINATVRATRLTSEEELAELTACRLDSFLVHGTTTLEVKSGYGLTLEDERKMLRAAAVTHPTRRVRTMLAAHFTPPEYTGDDDAYVDLVTREMVPALRDEARFCDVFCDEGAFTVEQSRRVLEAARAAGYGLKVHADELARSGGALLAAELGCVSADHLVHAGEGEIAALRSAGVVAVLLPGTSFTLHSSYAPARAFVDAGVAIALASDFNPGTCYCENLQVMISLACQEMRLTPAEALGAATLGGARALGLQAEVGSLEVGKRCDLVVLAAATHRELPYHFGVNLVDAVVIDGMLVVAGGTLVAGEPGRQTGRSGERTDAARGGGAGS